MKEIESAEEKLLALVSKTEQISDIEDLAAALVEWLAICPESANLLRVLHRYVDLSQNAKKKMR